ncbi:hypothetical protein [Rhizobium sp. LjRoot254]|uniref:hypothetical protein n=1 Tax=Rhizobium sp. LjRoot254 TaxID=3342297 RepID=UPI003ED0451F
MERDWLTVITEQGEIARIKIRVATILLADPDINPETVSRLYRDVEEKARQFDAVFLEISDELDLDHPLVDEALSVERLWSGMSVSIADRISSMAGRSTNAAEDG